MNWLFRNPARRLSAQPHPRFRPRLEILERRDQPSVSVTPFTDPSGAAALRIVTNGADDTVSITDNSTAHTTTVVADGMMKTFNQQFARFDLELMSREDTVTFGLTGAYNGRHADILVNLGRGENHFTFNPGLTGLTNHSDLNLNILGHGGSDFLNLSFGDILESRLNLNARNLGGSMTPMGSTGVRDTITFGTLRAGGRNASIDVNVSFGQGNNNLLFNYGIDLGHLAPPAGTPAAAGDFGPGMFNVNITDSHRRQDHDNVTLFANGEINTGSTLNFNTQLGAGNNSFTGVFDANNFQVDDDGGVFSPGPTPGTFVPHSGGAVHMNILAGSGKDAIDLHSINQNHTTELSGLFDINILGGSRADTIKVDFGGTGFTDDDPFELFATNRAFRLRIDGGTGDDSIKVNLANAATATFAWDVAIQGGEGHNDITFVGTNPTGGNPSFGPAGSVLIDAGPGDHNTVDVMGNFPVEVFNAGQGPSAGLLKVRRLSPTPLPPSTEERGFSLFPRAGPASQNALRTRSPDSHFFRHSNKSSFLRGDLSALPVRSVHCRSFRQQLSLTV
jgi:TolB-like protein